MHSTQPPYSKPPHCLSIQAYWQYLVTRLQDAGCDCARQEATAILRHVTGQSTAAFFATLQRALSPAELATAEAFLERRLTREPLQHILGSVDFYGRTFLIDSRALVPRPETELLVDAAVAMAADLPLAKGALEFADVGTGSGCIAVTLAHELPHARITATDVSRAALELAQLNVAKHGVGSRVRLVESDLLSAVTGPLSAIVANLPYVRTSDISELQPEVSRFEPRRALDGGADGLDIIRRLVHRAPELLPPGGGLCLETGLGQASAVLSILEAQQQWCALRTQRDLQGIVRVVSARRT